MKTQIILLFSCLNIATISYAQSTRQHHSHAHGIGELNVVLEVDELAIELISPAANIVAFEHTPSSDEQIAAVVQAEQTLEQADKLFILSEQAGCQADYVHVESELLEGHQDDHEEHHDEHAGEAHKDEHEEEIHSEFHVEYKFHCDDVEKLTQIQIKLFDTFPATEEINVQLLTPDQQTAIRLDKNNSIIEL